MNALRRAIFALIVLLLLAACSVSTGDSCSRFHKPQYRSSS